MITPRQSSFKLLRSKQEESGDRIHLEMSAKEAASLLCALEPSNCQAPASDPSSRREVGSLELQLVIKQVIASLLSIELWILQMS